MTPRRTAVAAALPAAPARSVTLPPPDGLLLLAVATILSFGLVAVYSASAHEAIRRFQDADRFLQRQILAAAIGLGAAYFASRAPVRLWGRLAPYLAAFVGLGLAAVLVPALGREIAGARRWLPLGPFHVQPSEFAKLAVVLYAAHLAARRPALLSTYPGFLKALAVPAALAALILLQPDFEASLVVVGIAVAVLFVAGARLPHLLGTALAAAPVVAALVWAEPYRMRRVLAFLDPWADPQDRGYQIIQCWIALGSGGLWGKGLGGSELKNGFLPEAHTDFIFAVVGEETGFLGASVFLAAFVILLWRGMRVAARLADPFSRYAAVGLTAMIVGQALVNLGVVTGLLPTTGVTLPLVSYGGSSVVLTLLALGILLGLSRGVARRPGEAPA